MAVSSLFRHQPTAPCAGISVDGATPPVCEVHLLPWGHPKIRRDPFGGLIGWCPRCEATWAGADETVLDLAETHKCPRSPDPERTPNP